MKAYEGGDLSTAERVKNELEEDQRQRRKVMENEGKEHEVKFFHHVGDGGPDSGEWVYNSGEKSYWNRRKNQDWDDLLKLWFNLSSELLREGISTISEGSSKAPVANPISVFIVPPANPPPGEFMKPKPFLFLNNRN
ncbi:hypothetical protein QCA50_021194 [Cerrena zonata]|uniref:Uncharacterized protein n=1 Tax=Cerrena zonata TaxID=2478898 RepID=A0AAW0FBN4_9APHY